MDLKEKRRKGRPSRDEPRKMIYFKESTLKIWNARKKELSASRGRPVTSDEFAVFLLKISGQGGVYNANSNEGGRTAAQTVIDDHNYGLKDVDFVYMRS